MIFTNLCLSPKRFARSTIIAFIFSLINIALVIKLLENILDILFVILISRPYKIIIVNIHHFPKFFYVFYNTINIFLWFHAKFLSFFFYLLTMFISTSSKENIITLNFLKSLDAINCNSAVSMTNVKIITWIINWRRNIKFLITHKTSIKKPNP